MGLVWGGRGLVGGLGRGLGREEGSDWFSSLIWSDWPWGERETEGPGIGESGLRGEGVSQRRGLGAPGPSSRRSWACVPALGLDCWLHPTREQPWGLA